MALFYVAVLYAPTHVLRLPPASSLNTFMIRRFISAILASLASILLCARLLPVRNYQGASLILSICSIRLDHLGRAVAIPLCLTSLFYAGSIVSRLLSFSGAWEQEELYQEAYLVRIFKAVSQRLVDDAHFVVLNILAWRNYVVISTFEKPEKLGWKTYECYCITVNTRGLNQIWRLILFLFWQQKPEDETSLEHEGKCSFPSPKNVHHPVLLQILSEEMGCIVDQIMEIELNLCDTQPSCLGGAHNEFIYSGRLDNLASSFCALRALIDSCNSSESLLNESSTRMVALFDNEEVGSSSVQGAGAPTMFQAMRHIIDCLGHDYVGEVSADMAHGVHPNFIEKYEDQHRPVLQKGMVIKHNANQRYATNALTAFLFKQVARAHNLPTQEFVVRNDTGCGSTIGPILATGVGMRTVDCGIPQLSMHSIREICGKEDVDVAYKIFMAFYRTFSTLDKKLNVDG